MCLLPLYAFRRKMFSKRFRMDNNNNIKIENFFIPIVVLDIFMLMNKETVKMNVPL